MGFVFVKSSEGVIHIIPAFKNEENSLSIFNDKYKEEGDAIDISDISDDSIRFDSVRNNADIKDVKAICHTIEYDSLEKTKGSYSKYR